MLCITHRNVPHSDINTIHSMCIHLHSHTHPRSKKEQVLFSFFLGDYGLTALLNIRIKMRLHQLLNNQSLNFVVL